MSSDATFLWACSGGGGGPPPAQDSTFSSGFEEEFSIARIRREQTPSPEIWMFFKTVESAQIADAGTQLQRVISFRESLITSKTISFKEFDGVDAWEKMLRSYLLKHVLDLSRTQSGAPEGPTERAAPPPTTSVSIEANAPGKRRCQVNVLVRAEVRSLGPRLLTASEELSSEDRHVYIGA
jgi:hypothetical protein